MTTTSSTGNALVEQYMTSSVQTIAQTMALPKAVQILAASRYSAFPVVDDAEAIVGVLSRTDILQYGASHRTANAAHALAVPNVAVATVMSQGPLVVSPTTRLAEAARTLVELGVHRMFVVAHGRLVGVLSSLDVTRAVADAKLPTPLGNYSTNQIRTIDAEANVAQAIAELTASKVTSLVVVDGAGTSQEWPVGSFGNVEALLAHRVDPGTHVADVMERAIVCMQRDTKLWHAASQAVAMDVRRLIVCEKGQTTGIASTLDLCRAFAEAFA